MSDKLPAVAVERGIPQPVWSAMTTSLYPGARPESVALVYDYCKARGLDPLSRPVHIVPMSVTDATTGEKSWRDVIMKGISELRTTAARTGEYAGQDDPEFGPVSEYLGVSAPEWCKVTVYRIVQGQRVAFTHTEYFTEAVATTRKNNQEVINRMWSKRPRGQLAKCAEAGALRKGFPEEIGGELAAEEMEGKVIDGTAERIDPIDTSTVQRRSEPKRSEPKNREDPAKKAQDGPEPAIPENGVQLLERKMEAAGVDRDEFCHAFGVEALVSLPASKMTAAIKWINEQA